MLALDRLEFGAIRAALRQRTATPLGGDRADALVPFAHPEDARARIELTKEMRALLLRGSSPSLGGATDVLTALGLAEKGVTLDGEALRAIAQTMLVGDGMRRYLLAREDEAPGLYAIGAGLDDLHRPGKDIADSFEPDGRLADDASPELLPLRRRVRSLREAIKDKISGILAADDVRPYLQESYFTVRGDRYVVPIKASFKHVVTGIVHDASGSGQTVFIEPQAIVDLGNKLKIAQSELADEEQRILRLLTDIVRAHASELRAHVDAIGHVDFVLAAATLAEDLEAAPIAPDPEPGFTLHRARHPLLVLKQREDPTRSVVANDLGLSPVQRVLVITGPNTGGKTVAMKTIGLLALMLKAGLHLPCRDDSRLGWFEPIEATIGDDQSIQSQLSTFAAHLGSLMRILAMASGRSLVLLDEIAADTDPNQGQALAQAILEAFADLGAHTVVTTHFERLKAIAYADPRFRNAGVGFDPVRLRPTYRVTLDLPQGSSGIDIASTLGLAPKVVARARELVGEQSGAFDALMKALSEKAHELEEAKARAEKKELELRDKERAFERRRSEMEAEHRRVISHARDGLIKELDDVRDEARDILKGLQHAIASDEVKAAMRRATESVDRLAQIREQERLKAREGERRDPAEALAEVQVGDWVHVESLGKDGEVVAIGEDRALVAVGRMRTRVPLKQLTKARSRAPKGGAKLSAAEDLRRARERTRPAEGAPITEQLDVRGATTDEALARVDAFLDRHYGGPSHEVRIVHGHGGGALKAAIREHLGRSGYVRQHRPGNDQEGGDGATIVELL